MNHEPAEHDLPLDYFRLSRKTSGDRTMETELLNKKFTETHPHEKLEGNAGHAYAVLQQNAYVEWAQKRGAKTHCETGFNAGHSALLFLAESGAHAYEFDLGQHECAKTAMMHLPSRFPNRLNVTWGDSTKTMP